MPGFFDRVKAVTGEKVMEAQIRSREALESQQVKGKISDLQSQRSRALAELGESVYGMYQKGSFDQEALIPPCDAVSAIDTQITEKEAELEEVHRRAEMALSGQVRPEERPAPAPMEAAPAPMAAAEDPSAPAPAAKSSFCPECGQGYEGAPRFCPNCGYKFA